MYSAGICSVAVLLDFVQGVYGGCGDSLDGEGTGDAGLPGVLQRVVVQRFGDWRFVVRDRARRHVWSGLIQESAIHAFIGMRKAIVIEHRCHESLLGKRQCNSGAVTCDPAASPFLRNDGRRSAPARDVEDKVSRIGRHQNTAFDDLGVCPELRRFGPARHRTRPTNLSPPRTENQWRIVEADLVLTDD